MSRNQSVAMYGLFLLLFIGVSTPAQMAAELLKKSASPLTLKGLSGTLWSGQATQSEIDWMGRRWLLGSLNWTVVPWSLLTLSPCARVVSVYQRQSIDTTLCLNFDGSWSVNDAAVKAPASVLNTWSPAPIEGDLDLVIEALVLNTGGVTHLQADATWREAHIDGGQNWVALGNLASRWRGDVDGRIRADIFDLQGPAAIALTLTSDRGQPLSLEGQIELRQGAPVQLTEFLQVFASSPAPGRFTIDWQE